MNKSIKNSLKWIVLLSIPALLWVACKEDEPQLNLSRQFKPAAFNITEGETSATIEWSRSLFTLPGEVEYVVELSKDVTFSTIEFTHTTAEAGVTVLDTDIDIKVDHFARVKAVGKGNTADSNWLISNPFQITGEVLILPVNEYDILPDGVLIHWELDEVLSKMTFTPQGGSPFDVTISLAEYNAGQKLVSGLNQNTNYTTEIFNATNVSKGSVSFRTKNGYTDSNIVDLRGISGKPKILRDTLQDIPAGSVVYLKRGQTYTFDNTDAAGLRNITRTVTIMSGPDLNANLAKIHLTTFFNLVAATNYDSIVFKDVIIKGVRAAGASFDNDYLINSNVAANVGVIRLENCKISRLRGTVRGQAAGAGTKIANYYINRCSLDSIREFAVVMASGTSAFANVKITNSTFYKCRRYVNHGVAGNNSLTLENCTFNENPSGGLPAATPANFLIDYTTGFGTSVTIKNCIIGKNWLEVAGQTESGGIRISASASVNVTNTYTLSDFVNPAVAFQIPGSVAYTGSSTTVFQAPSTGNFKIIDTAFPGASSAGDPKWRP